MLPWKMKKMENFIAGIYVQIQMTNSTAIISYFKLI